MSRIKDSDFNEYVGKISIQEDERSRLISSHTNIRNKIQNSKFKDDLVDTLLSGSYKKDTIVKSGTNSKKKVDVDILLIFKYGKEDIKPQSLLDKVRNEIEEMNEYKGKTVPQKRSIGIELVKTHMDVIPVLQAKENTNRPLLISSKNKQEWDETNPLESIDYFNNNAKGNDIRPIVKIFKWWKILHKPENYKYPISYAFEVLTIQNYIKDNNKFESFIRTYEKINSYFQSHSTKPILKDPCGKNDLLKKMNDASYTSFRDKFNKMYCKLKKGYDEGEIEVIKEVLGSDFPNCTIYTEEDRHHLEKKASGIKTYGVK